MGQNLSPEQMELYRRIDEIIHYLWDPIGVSGIPQARDEYDSYLPHIYSLILHKAPSSEVADFLVKTEVETMGLKNTEQVQKRANDITETLEDYRDFISEKQSSNFRSSNEKHRPSAQ